MSRGQLAVLAVWLWLLSPSESAAPADDTQTIVLPIPVVPASKNEGASVGTMVPIIRTDAAGQVQDIIMPMLLYNDDLFGVKVGMNYYKYWPNERLLKLTATYGTKIERRLRLDYLDRNFGGGRYVLDINLEMDRTGSERFFGFTQGSLRADETNYTLREVRARVAFGWKLPVQWIVGVQELVRDDAVYPGAFNDELPFTSSLFPTVPGVDGATLLSHRIWALYDSRDSWFTPTQGTYISLIGEGTNGIRKAGAFYTRYGIDARHLLPLFEQRVVVAGRVLLQSVDGPDIPFFDRSRLGGEQTLRGFGRDRFIDDTVVAVNVEARVRLLRARVFKTVEELELAPFVDMGRVMGSYRDFFQGYAVTPGIGLRVVARPYIVARVDVGYGKEGGSVFAGIYYAY